jgi:hypothetical protein
VKSTLQAAFLMSKGISQGGDLWVFKSFEKKEPVFRGRCSASVLRYLCPRPPRLRRSSRGHVRMSLASALELAATTSATTLKHLDPMLQGWLAVRIGLVPVRFAPVQPADGP